MDTKQILDKTKRRLGRGLSSLIGDPVPVLAAAPVEGSSATAVAEPPSEPRAKPPDPERRWIHEEPQASPSEVRPAIQPTAAQPGVVNLLLAEIVPSRFQPRRDMDPAALERLAESVKRSGLIQPVVVRPRAGTDRRSDPAAYELVAGERRWRAAALAGLARIPAVIRALTDEEAAEWGLVENLQREDLNPMDRAASLRTLCDRFKLTQDEVAVRVGLDRSTIANLIRLMELEEPLARLVATGVLSAGHGRALLAIGAGERRVRLGERAGSERWSVRRLEREARSLAGGGGSGGGGGAGSPDPFEAREAARQRLEKRLSEHLGTKCAVATDRSGARGRISIEFYTLDHFDGLLARLGLDARE